jgi:general secretion pathway protein B
MSYILEALKKSDKERQRDKIPDLQADHSLPPLRREERKSCSWCLPGAVILVLLCGGGLFWWQQGTEKKVQPVAVEAAAVSPAPPPAQEAQMPANRKIPAKSVSPASVAEKKSVPVEKIAARFPAEQAELVPPLMEELPVAIRAAIPDLSFAGHVYSDVPQKRLIIINNRIVREGDLIANGLSLEKIEPNGVVLRYEMSFFRVKLF